MKRAAKVIAAALEDSESCPLLLEQTAGHKGLLGRDFDETAELIELAGSGRRLGLCLDSCHLFVQGFDVTDAEHLSEVVDEADAKVGLERLRCLHVNDAAAPLGSCRDRHANIGKGEMGKRGLAAFLSEPRFEGLPATLETPGPQQERSRPKGSAGGEAPPQSGPQEGRLIAVRPPGADGRRRAVVRDLRIRCARRPRALRRSRA